jgi:osmotically-inducible protein OsmY
MPIWRLSPVDLADPNWEASSHRAATLVRAPTEEAAREVAQSAFGVKTRFNLKGPVITPWKRAEMVRAERISDDRFAPDGPAEVLSPSFESDEAPGEGMTKPAALRGTRSPQRQPKAQTLVPGLASNEERLAFLEKIRAAIRGEPRLGTAFEGADIGISSDGVVTLTAELPGVGIKKLLLERVAAVPGVAGIADRLRVQPAAPMGDSEIRVHLRDMLIREHAFKELEIREVDAGRLVLARGVPSDGRGAIEIEVEDGAVCLDGRVPDLVTKRLAGAMAWWVPGTRDVVNGIAVEPPEEDSPDTIAEALRIILEKDPFINANQVRAGVRGAVVRLTGLVPTEAERQAAERDAWCTFAVDDVINEIAVRR